jgi:hypothetical protein
MKSTRKIFGTLTASLLLAACAFAGPDSKGQLRVAETVTIGSTQLRSGTYQLEWTGSGPNVELSISNGRETVAKVPAQLVSLEKAGSGDGYSTNTEPSGNKTLTGIFFKGKKYQVSFGEASAASGTASNKADGRN